MAFNCKLGLCIYVYRENRMMLRIAIEGARQRIGITSSVYTTSVLRAEIYFVLRAGIHFKQRTFQVVGSDKVDVRLCAQVLEAGTMSVTP